MSTSSMDEKSSELPIHQKAACYLLPSLSNYSYIRFSERWSASLDDFKTIKVALKRARHQDRMEFAGALEAAFADLIGLWTMYTFCDFYESNCVDECLKDVEAFVDASKLATSVVPKAPNRFRGYLFPETLLRSHIRPIKEIERLLGLPNVVQPLIDSRTFLEKVSEEDWEWLSKVSYGNLAHEPVESMWNESPYSELSRTRVSNVILHLSQQLGIQCELAICDPRTLFVVRLAAIQNWAVVARRAVRPKSSPVAKTEVQTTTQFSRPVWEKRILKVGEFTSGVRSNGTTLIPIFDEFERRGWPDEGIEVPPSVKASREDQTKSLNRFLKNTPIEVRPDGSGKRLLWVWKTD